MLCCLLKLVTDVSDFRMFLMDEKNLKIEKLKDSDEGVYICRAENSFGYVEAEAKLTVYC